MDNLENLQIPIGPYTEAKIIQLQQSDFIPKHSSSSNGNGNNNNKSNNNGNQGGITNMAYEENNTTHL